MNQDIALEINKLTKDYMSDNVDDNFEYADAIINTISSKAADLDILERLKLIGQTIPLLFNHPAASDVHFEDLNPLGEILHALQHITTKYAFETFVAETKIETTPENEKLMWNFFMAKGNFQCNKARKEEMAVLIEALLKSYNAL